MKKMILIVSFLLMTSYALAHENKRFEIVDGTVLSGHQENGAEFNLKRAFLLNTETGETYMFNAPAKWVKVAREE